MDNAYKKQLEVFGIDSVSAVESEVQKKQVDDEKRVMLSIVRSIMERMEGRQWIYSKLDMCKIFTTPFVPSDSHGTSFFSGIQAVGQNLLNDIMQACPEQFYLMIQEASARKNGNNQD